MSVESPYSVVDLPDDDLGQVYSSLVGIDTIKERLEKESESMLRPDLLEAWSMQQYKTAIPALSLMASRPPLFIFSGDVGTGKTALATSFGNRLARKTNTDVKLYALSLKARGSGIVGDMTNVLTTCFAELIQAAKAANKGKSKRAFIFHIDEADSLAQSREMKQMHHEDRAGVNALIRGIDDLAAAKCNCLVVMCTNRLDAIDPAIKRRAAAIFVFERPGVELIKQLLDTYLDKAGLKEKELSELAKKMAGTDHGYTYSDIMQRFIPSLVMDAYPDNPITYELALETLKRCPPTRPFVSEA